MSLCSCRPHGPSQGTPRVEQGDTEVRAAAVNEDSSPTSPLTPVRAPVAPRLASTPNTPIVRSLMVEATAASPGSAVFDSCYTDPKSYSTARDPIVISSDEESDAGEDTDVFEGFDERVSPPIKEDARPQTVLELRAGFGDAESV
ncbi:hypothetical protein ABEF93_008637 [Exophiala dermatitidis]